MKNIRVGYELVTGKPLDVPLRHTAVSGITQQSGKTTTLEAMTTRSGLRAIAFLTKKGEKGFRLMRTIPPYLEQKVDWQSVQAILESTMTERMKFQRSWIMEVCEEKEPHHIGPAGCKYCGAGVPRKVLQPGPKGKGKKFVTVRDEDPEHKANCALAGWDVPESLEDVQSNLRKAIQSARGLNESVYRELIHYLDIVIPQVKRLKYSQELKLAPGINVMDLTDCTEELQSLIIGSTIDYIYENEKNTITIIPEAARLLPRQRSSPVSMATENLIRQGGTQGNWIWLDTQDLASVSTPILKSISVWILGVQREGNEVQRTLDLIPIHPKLRPIEVQELGRGQFIVAYDKVVAKVYVQPAGMEPEHAQAIAMGDESVDSWAGIVAKLPKPAPEIVVDWPTKEEIERSAKADFPNSPIHAADAKDKDFTPKYVGPTTQEEHRAGYGYGHVAVEEKPEDEMDGHTAALLNQQKKEIEDLKIENTQLRFDISLLRAGSLPPMPAPQMSNSAPHVPSGLTEEGKGQILQDFKAYLLKDAQVIALLAAKPRIEVIYERPTIHLDLSTMQGQVAKLIADGFFKSAKAGADVARELKRRGQIGSKTPTTNIYPALNKLAEQGFLTIEAGSFLAVPGMEVNIKEKK